MLTRLSQAASRTFTSTVEVGARCLVSGEEGEVLNVHVEELCQLVLPFPQLTWGKVSDLCTRTVAPVCNVLWSTLNDDVEQLAQLFRETYFEPAERDVLPTRLKRCASTHDLANLTSSPPEPSRARRRSLIKHQNSPLVISNDDPAIPTIVITPCPSLPRQVTCLVPYQDAAFGNRLPVPTHPVLNDVFPPLVAKPFPLVERWRYQDGHWHAQLPPVQEQVSKGMFSRPLSTRRQRAQDASRAHSLRARTVYSRRSHREG
ncbi:hypothetical protein C8Q80DRAFT_1129169 [Daedaleopsis nitida]|nr:hypothetical protein C8Q80DRAFT_1129169 [Daedaleopsis nitida]